MKSRLSVALLAAAVVCTAITFVPGQPAYASDRTVICELFVNTG